MDKAIKEKHDRIEEVMGVTLSPEGFALVAAILHNVHEDEEMLTESYQCAEKIYDLIQASEYWPATLGALVSMTIQVLDHSMACLGIDVVEELKSNKKGEDNDVPEY